MLQRPSTLAEVTTRCLYENADFGMEIRDFLTEFYLQKPERRVGMLADEPPLLKDDAQRNVFVAACAEFLSGMAGVCKPAWVDNPVRFLKEPIYDHPNKDLWPIFERESPEAFRRRNIFTEANPLRRAAMNKAVGLNIPKPGFFG